MTSALRSAAAQRMWKRHRRRQRAKLALNVLHHALAAAGFVAAVAVITWLLSP
jgi:hypothetical protein